MSEKIHKLEGKSEKNKSKSASWETQPVTPFSSFSPMQ